MPKTKDQNQVIRQRAKNKIVSSALITFSRYGFHGASINMIAKHAQISKGLIYNYFLNKKEILEFILKKQIDNGILFW